MLCPYKWIQAFVLPDTATKSEGDQPAEGNEPWPEILAAVLI